MTSADLTHKRHSAAAWLGWARIAVSIGTIVLVLTLVKPSTVLNALAHVSLGLWVGVLCLYLLGHVISAYKWRLLAAPEATFIAALRAHFSGLAANIALPGAASGDLVRAGVMFAGSQDRARVSVGSLADRIIDTAGLCLLALAGMVCAGRGAKPEILAIIAAVILMTPLAFVLARPILAALAARLDGPGKLTRLALKVVQAGLQMCRAPLRLLICLVLSMLVQSAFILAGAKLGEAAGVSIDLGAWFFAWPVSKLVATIPTSAGGLGVREASLAGILIQFGADGGKVFTSGLVWQSIIIVGAVVGSIATWLLAMSEHRKTSSSSASPQNEIMIPQASSDRHATRPRIAVLGAGPAGIGAAYYLAKFDKAHVEVFDASNDVGGAAGGQDIEGIHTDLGSHRFHPAAEPDILDDVKSVLGTDLLWRPRHGRIRLQGRWIHFPLKPFDFLKNAQPAFILSITFDVARKLLPRRATADENFATVLEHGLGRTICRSFYFPYAVKLWGVPPQALDATAARRRVSGSSIAKMVSKVLGQIPGLKKATTGGFFYPRGGFRQISDGFRAEAEKHGAIFKLQHRVVGILKHPAGGFRLDLETPQGRETREVDYVWSSIPLTVLARAIEAPRSAELDKAIAEVRYRSMILIYVVLETQQFTEYDAHYFPEIEIPLSRLSEPKNYYASQDPRGVTVLCGELPCSTEDPYWTMSDDELGALMVKWLDRAALPVTARVRRSFTRRLSHAYPIYDRDFGEKLDQVETWVGAIPGLVTFGRQGLFAHDNTHHALAMAKAATRCLRNDGGWDDNEWAKALESFKAHVVED